MVKSDSLVPRGGRSSSGETNFSEFVDTVSHILFGYFRNLDIYNFQYMIRPKYTMIKLLQCTKLHCTTLHFTAQITLHIPTTLHFTTPNHTTHPYHNTLHRTKPHYTSLPHHYFRWLTMSWVVCSLTCLTPLRSARFVHYLMSDDIFLFCHVSSRYIT